MAQLFAHAPVAIAVLRGPDHVYELANDHYHELVGGRDVVGKPIREALPELAGRASTSCSTHVRPTGEPYVGESVAVTLNRGADREPERAFFDFVYQPVFDDDGARRDHRRRRRTT